MISVKSLPRWSPSLRRDSLTEASNRELLLQGLPELVRSYFEAPLRPIRQRAKFPAETVGKRVDIRKSV